MDGWGGVLIQVRHVGVNCSKVKRADQGLMAWQLQTREGCQPRDVGGSG